MEKCIIIERHCYMERWYLSVEVISWFDLIWDICMEKKNGLRLMERIFGKKDVCHYNAQYFTKIQKGKKVKWWNGAFLLKWWGHHSEGVY